MDLSLALVGILGVVGYNMNTTVNSRSYIQKRTNVPDSEKGSGKNVYESKDYNKVHEDEQRRLTKNTNSRQSSTNLGKARGPNPPAKKVTFYGEDDSSSTVKQPRTKDRIFEGPMFSLEKFYQPEEDNKDFVVKENFGNEAVSELTGSKSDFSHNNMVPFFGGKIKGGGSSAGILDRYSGKDKQAKQEVEAVHNSKENVYGLRPFTTLLDQDRFNPGNNQGGVVPFKQYRVAPIPGEYVRPEFKNVDELRYLSNPKSELEGRMNSGSGIGKRSEIGDGRGVTVERNWGMRETMPTGNKDSRTTGFMQNHAETFKDTTRSSTTETSFNLMPAFSRQTSEYTGYTNNEDGKSTLNSEVKRGSYKNDWIRNNRQQIPLRFEKEQNNIHLRTQEREDYMRENIGGGFDKSKGMRINTTDKPRTTNKQLTVYEYTGSANSQNIHMPENRNQYYTTELKDKALASNYTFNGVAFGAPGAGVESVNMGIKQRPTYEHIGAGKSNKMTVPDAGNLGENAGKASIYGMEHDFSDRLNLKR